MEQGRKQHRMNQHNLNNVSSTPNSWHMVRALAGMGMLCSLLIVFTYQSTYSIIQKNKTEYLEQAVYKVLPGAIKRINFKLTNNNQFEILEQETQYETVVYAGYNDDGDLVGIALEAQGQGFQDVLKVLYGYSPEHQTIIGIAVLESKETPGLGDKIEKDQNFINNFIALDLSLSQDGTTISNPIIPVKNGAKANSWEVECITGATISSKAIANMLRKNTDMMIPKIMVNLAEFKNVNKQITE